MAYGKYKILKEVGKLWVLE